MPCVFASPTFTPACTSLLHPSYSPFSLAPPPLPLLPGACWAYATVDAVASVFAIRKNNASGTPPLLPAYQLFDTSAAPGGPCSAGSPVTAMEYLVNASLAGDGLLPSDPTGAVLLVRHWRRIDENLLMKAY